MNQDYIAIELIANTENRTVTNKSTFLNRDSEQIADAMELMIKHLEKRVEVYKALVEMDKTKISK